MSHHRLCSLACLLSVLLCAAARPQGPVIPNGQSKVRVQITFEKSTALSFREELICSNPCDLNAFLNRDFALKHRDESGMLRALEPHIDQVRVNGSEASFQVSSSQEVLHLQVDPRPVVRSGASSAALSYSIANALSLGPSMADLRWELRWPIPIDEALVTVELPTQTTSESASVTAFTGVTATTTWCDCSINSSNNSVQIKTNRRLLSAQPLTIEVRVPTRGFEPSFVERMESLRENHLDFVAWTLFIVTNLTSFLVIAATLRLGFRINSLEKDWFNRTRLMLISASLSALSFLWLLALRDPHVALPGVYVGMVASMILGGSLHGAEERWLWLPLAWACNFLFYLALVQAVLWLSKLVAGKANSQGR